MVGNGYVRLYNILVLHVNGISIRVRNWHFFGPDSRELTSIVNEGVCMGDGLVFSCV